MASSYLKRMSSGLLVRVISTVLQTITLLILARQLEAVSFGYYASTVSAATFVGAVLTFGASMRIIYLSAPGQAQLLTTLRLVSIAGSFTSGVLSVGLAVLIWGSENLLLLVAAAAAVFVEVVYTAEANSHFARGAVRKAELLILAKRLLPFTFIVVGFFFSRLEVTVFYLAGLCLSSLLIAIVVLSSLRLRGMFSAFIEAVRTSRHYWVSTIMATFQQLDVLIVGGLMGGAQAGGYAAGYRVASPAHLITTSITAITIPSVANETISLSERKVALRSLNRYMGAYACGLIILSPLAALIAPLLLGKSYEDFRWLFALFVVNAAVNSWVQSRIGVANSFGYSAYVASFLSVSTVASLSLIAMFALVDTLIGVCIALLVSQIVQAIVFSFVARKGSECLR
ncbi:hypothetical protein [Dietzia sp. B32]|uniref:hypothetical protein n=1 Tax=Dietzia sp. B32 TaxID=2915130 RepID=UPI0021AD8910|nr:hypothetical protein [Dietzia sp. B32]UVE96442.1 hypothetical protein L8M95_06650 [Dietzia sp. B32]